MNNPAISVAMATFNGERFLAAQLESLANQTLQPSELVVTDDGSTDSTVAILEEYARLVAFPVRLFRNEGRLGFADNFMRAASLCRGEVIAFCDQDDVWLPHKLARYTAAFDDQSVVLAIHSGTVVNASLQALGEFKPHIRCNEVIPPLYELPHRYIPGFSMAFRSDIPLLCRGMWPIRVGGQEFRLSTHSLSHDTWVYYHAWVFGKIAYLHEPLVLHRRHSQTATGWMPPSQQEKALSILTAGAEHFLSGADHHKVVADYLMERRNLLLSRGGRQAEEGARAFRRIERILRDRSRLYKKNAGWAGRSILLLQMLLSGHYMSIGQSGFGLGSLIKDAVAGLMQINSTAMAKFFVGKRSSFLSASRGESGVNKGSN